MVAKDKMIKRDNLTIQGFITEITIPVFRLHEATGPNLEKVFQLFRVRQFRSDITIQRRKKWKIRSDTAMCSGDGEGGEPM